MVDLSDFIEPPEDEEPEDDGFQDDRGVAEDFAALRDCLQALADAIASTNLAVISNAHGDVAGAGARVQASVGALKRFHAAFTVLKGEEGPKEEED